jgi:serine protease Do
LAGLEVYDLILSADGRDIADDDALIREISLRQPGSTVSLEVLRDTQQHTILVRLAERPAAEQAMIGPQDAGDRPASDGDARPPGTGTIGLVVRDMEDGFSRRFNVPSSVRGVVVADVDAAGPAYAADIRSGLVIMEVNRRPVHTAAQFDRLVSGARPGDALALLIYNPVRPARDLIALTVDEIR